MPRTTGIYRIKLPKSFSVQPDPLGKILGRTMEGPPYGTPPLEWPGTTAEWAVAWALQQLHVEYEYQVPFDGGRTQRGGGVIDFFVPDRQLAIRVQGVYWHYERSSLAMTIDDVLKESMLAKGLQVVDIDEDDALRDPIYYVGEALRGVDHSRGVTGV